MLSHFLLRASSSIFLVPSRAVTNVSTGLFTNILLSVTLAPWIIKSICPFISGILTISPIINVRFSFLPKSFNAFSSFLTAAAILTLPKLSRLLTRSCPIRPVAPVTRIVFPVNLLQSILLSEQIFLISSSTMIFVLLIILNPISANFHLHQELP